MHDVFDRWNKGPLDSYLIEITRDILGLRRPRDQAADGRPDPRRRRPEGDRQVDRHLGLRPGRAADLDRRGVFARCLSAQKDERVAASKVLKGPTAPIAGSTTRRYIDAIEQALYASKIISYAQGFALMNAMANESKWEINKGGVALMWRGGCIIRSAFLGKIKEAFDRNPKLANLLLDPYFRGEIDRCQDGWRRAAAAAVDARHSRSRP